MWRPVTAGIIFRVVAVRKEDPALSVYTVILNSELFSVFPA